MRICKLKDTGRIIEMQSGPGSIQSLIDNAITAGYSKDNIIVEITQDYRAWDQLNEQASTEEGYATKRQKEYPAIGDQLDAILKQLNYDRLNGRALVQDMDNIIGQWLEIKERYPKE